MVLSHETCVMQSCRQVVVDHSAIAMSRATSIAVGAASVYGVGLASPDPGSHAMFTTFSLACIAGYYTVSAWHNILPPLSSSPCAVGFACVLLWCLSRGSLARGGACRCGEWLLRCTRLSCLSRTRFLA
jgi:hypothetical protein